MKVTLVIWSDPAWYQAVGFTSQMLTEAGHGVQILHRSPNAAARFAGPVDFGKNARVYPIGTGADGWRNKLEFSRFVAAAALRVRQTRPEIIFGYDLYGFIAAWIARKAHPKARLIYHNFDLTDRKSADMTDRVLLALEQVGARSAERVIFPSEGRAQLFQSAARLKREPFIVRNCQRKCTQLVATGEVGRLLEANGHAPARLVVRLGSIGPHHGIEATIRSMPMWKGDWGLILGGFPIAGYMEKMQQIVHSLDLQSRVLFLPSIPYSLWNDCLGAAHLGVALYEPSNVNHANMAGAGQKLYSYLSAGIPSIVPNLPDFADFARRHGGVRVAEPTDPCSVAEAVNAVLSEPETYSTYCLQAKHAFKSEFHYERQFEPVWRWLQGIDSTSRKEVKG
jgi:glycosyltransferase involved in cell wall biosynthesis